MVRERVWAGAIFTVGIGDVEMRIAEVTLDGLNLRDIIVLPSGRSVR